MRSRIGTMFLETPRPDSLAGADTHREAAPMRSANMADVAARAGTSPSAVSRVLNGRPGVRPDVREAVFNAARELGYSAHPAARNLALGRTGLVSLVISDRDVVVGTTFFSELVASIVTELDDADYQTVLVLPPELDARTADSKLRLERFDGCVVIGHRSNDLILQHALSRNIPTVTLGRPSIPDLPYVDVDNVAAAEAVTDHLLRLGRSRIGILAGPQETTWGADRLAGFRNTIERAGLVFDPATVEVCPLTSGGGHAGMLSLLERKPDLDTLLISSESHLPGALAALQASGRRIPDDVAIASFDDGSAAQLASPPITSVRQPLADLGHELGRLILAAIAHDTDISSVTMAATLVARESTILAP